MASRTVSNSLDRMWRIMTTASEVRPRETIAATTIRAMSSGIEVVAWMSSVVGKLGLSRNCGYFLRRISLECFGVNTFVNGFHIIDIWHDVLVALNVSEESVLRRKLLPVLFVPPVLGNGNHHNYRSDGGGRAPCSRFVCRCCRPLRGKRDWICCRTRRFGNVGCLVPAAI